MTNLATLPADIAESLSELDPAPVAFRAITESGPICHDGCMAAGSSPHSHSTITGWLIIFERSILQLDAGGMGVRDSILHPFPN